LGEDVRQCIRRIKASPFIPRKNVRGFVYDVATGTLREVEDGSRSAAARPNAPL